MRSDQLALTRLTILVETTVKEAPLVNHEYPYS